MDKDVAIRLGDSLPICKKIKVPKSSVQQKYFQAQASFHRENNMASSGM